MTTEVLRCYGLKVGCLTTTPIDEQCGAVQVWDMIKPYFTLLQEKADKLGVRLLDAFLMSGVSRSTYYRNFNQDTELRFSTTQTVEKYIEIIAAKNAAKKRINERENQASQDRDSSIS